jgi:hypothetical protein
VANATLWSIYLRERHPVLTVQETVGTTQSNFKRLSISPKQCIFVFLITRRSELILGVFSKLSKATIGFVISVRPSVRLSACSLGITRAPLDGFSWDSIFEDFSKISRVNSCLVKTWGEQYVIYAKAYAQLWQYHAELFLERETLQPKKFAQKIKTRILLLWDN